MVNRNLINICIYSVINYTLFYIVNFIHLGTRSGYQIMLIKGMILKLLIKLKLDMLTTLMKHLHFMDRVVLL